MLKSTKYITRNEKILVLILLMLLCCSQMRASVIAPKLHEKIKAAPKGRSLPVIVTLESQADIKKISKSDLSRGRSGSLMLLRQTAELTQRPVKEFLRLNNVKSPLSLWSINSLAFDAPPSVIKRLELIDGIAEIRYDDVVQLSVPEPQDISLLSAAQSNIQLINAPPLWDMGFTGNGITVAVVDSGVDVMHRDLAPKWRGGYNSWYDPYNFTLEPYDVNGHGTNVAGVIVGGDSGGDIIGTAYGAQWIAAKIFSDTNAAQYSRIHQSLQWLLDPDGDPSTDDAPDIVNNSWGIVDGVGQCETEFLPDIQLLQQLGIIVVCSAGNAGPGSSTSLSPANYPDLLSVGSVSGSKVVSLFSSRGPSPCGSEIFPSLCAPGSSIRTSDLTGGGVLPLSYTYASGTSIAAPHIAGAAALLLEAFPKAESSEIIGALKYSCEDLGQSGPDYDYGYGLANVSASYDYLKAEICYADVDNSGYVGISDLKLIAEVWLTSCGLCPEDIVKDGFVNDLDIAELAREYSMPGCR